MQKTYETVTCVAVEIFLLRLVENGIFYGVGWKSLLTVSTMLDVLLFLDVEEALPAADKCCFAL